MAQQVIPVIAGVDVDSRYLQIAFHGVEEVTRIENSRAAMRQWLRTLSGPVSLAVEATGCYHLELVDQAHARGVTVYLVNPYRLSRYRDSVGERNKTDRVDALLLARYLAHERDALRPYQPLSAGHRQAWLLLKRRAKLVQVEGILNESLQAVAGLNAPIRAVKQRLKLLRQAIERQLMEQIQRLGWQADYERCLSIKGVGTLTAAALTLAFHRGDFSHADAWVAFLGLDVRIRESGRYRGKAKLTKKGDSECRRLLHNAAMSAARSDLKAYYTRLLERGYATTQAYVAVARKLVRIAFSLLTQQQNYNPEKLKIA
jgi:transposase